MWHYPKQMTWPSAVATGGRTERVEVFEIAAD
jgi:hypothetical protein